jgi:hypothetical protein
VKFFFLQFVFGGSWDSGPSLQIKSLTSAKGLSAAISSYIFPLQLNENYLWFFLMLWKIPSMSSRVFHYQSNKSSLKRWKRVFEWEQTTCNNIAKSITNESKNSLLRISISMTDTLAEAWMLCIQSWTKSGNCGKLWRSQTLRHMNYDVLSQRYD